MRSNACSAALEALCQCLTRNSMRAPKQRKWATIAPAPQGWICRRRRQPCDRQSHGRSPLSDHSQLCYARRPPPRRPATTLREACVPLCRAPRPQLVLYTQLLHLTAHARERAETEENIQDEERALRGQLRVRATRAARVREDTAVGSDAVIGSVRLVPTAQRPKSAKAARYIYLHIVNTVPKMILRAPSRRARRSVSTPCV